MSQEFQNFTLVAPTYSKDYYHTVLVKYHGFDRNFWPTNKNRRLRDLAAKNLRIRNANKWKKMRFQDSFKTPPRSRDWKTNFRDHDLSGYYSPPLDIYIFQSEHLWHNIALTVYEKGNSCQINIILDIHTRLHISGVSHCNWGCPALREYVLA